MTEGANTIFYAIAASLGGLLTYIITSTKNRYQRLDSNFYAEAETCKTEVKRLTGEVLKLSTQVAALQTSLDYLAQENKELKDIIHATTGHKATTRSKRS